jgi:hypothetical protein
VLIVSRPEKTDPAEIPQVQDHKEEKRPKPKQLTQDTELPEQMGSDLGSIVQMCQKDRCTD